jgi:hypothetical protein
VSYIAEHIDTICGSDLLTELVSESVNSFKSPSTRVNTPTQVSASTDSNEIAADPASDVGFAADTTGSDASPELLVTQAANTAARTIKAIKLTNRNIPSPNTSQTKIYTRKFYARLPTKRLSPEICST